MKVFASQQEINLLSGAKVKTQDGLKGVVISAMIRFGVFEVNLRERELRKFGLRVKLQQKPFQILERLLGTPGEFVTRDELAQVLWPDLHVLFDRSLNTAVNALRRRRYRPYRVDGHPVDVATTFAVNVAPRK